jgi:hypothetical protein
MDGRVKPGHDEASGFPGAMQHEVLPRRTGIVTDAAFVTTPALQRTASQELRAALRPGNVLSVRLRGDDSEPALLPPPA